MDEQQALHPSRTPSERPRRQDRRAHRARLAVRPYITRNIPYYEVLDEEASSSSSATPTPSSRRSASTSATTRSRSSSGRTAGADVKGERVHFPRGMCRELVQTLGAAGVHAVRAQSRRATWSSAASNTVFAPAYGSPFVRNLDEGRRYARIEDFRNFVKLAYWRPRCITRAAPSASPSICRSTSGTSTWSTAT